MRQTELNMTVIPRHNLSTYGRRAFSVAGPAVCATNCVNRC